MNSFDVETNQSICETLANAALANEFRGWDPFDGLASKLFRATPLSHLRLVRLFWTQLFKLMPINMRELALVPKLQNAKAVSLCLRAFLLLDRRADAAQALVHLLAGRADIKKWGDCAWGYPFDWQARAFFVPAGVPNLICTAYAIRALMAAHNQGLIGTEQTTQLIVSGAHFVKNHLSFERPNGRLIIRYVPNSAALVYNVVAWGAYIFAAAFRLTGDAQWRQRATAAAQTVCDAQDLSGWWPYGESSHHNFVDGFHTGYNLEALTLVEQLAGIELSKTIETGLKDYSVHFFGLDGEPYYYRDRPLPIDCHSAAQGALTFLLVKPDAHREQLAVAIIDWATRYMWDNQKGRFFYQKTWATNRINYFRWTQAWMLLAVAAVSQPDMARNLDR